MESTLRMSSCLRCGNRGGAFYRELVPVAISVTQ